MLFRKMRLAEYVFQAEEDESGGAGGVATAIDTSPSDKHAEFESALDVMGVGEVDSPPVETATETDSGSESEAVNESTEDEVSDDKSAPVDDRPGDELLRLAKHYGVRDDEIEGRAARDLTSTLSAIGRQKFPHTSDLAMQPQPGPEPQPQQPQQQQPQQPVAGQPALETPYDSLSEHGYEPELINHLNAQHQQSLARQQNSDATIQQLMGYLNQQHADQQSQSQQAHIEYQQAVEEKIDALSNTARYGTTDNNTNTPEQRRNFDAVLNRVGEMQASGVRGVSLEGLVHQAEFDLFGQQARQEATKSKLEAVRRQSRKVSHRPATQKQAGSNEEWHGDPEDDPVIAKMFRDMKIENGQA